jgi:hypothetical protein
MEQTATDHMQIDLVRVEMEYIVTLHILEASGRCSPEVTKTFHKHAWSKISKAVKQRLDSSGLGQCLMLGSCEKGKYLQVP